MASVRRARTLSAMSDPAKRERAALDVLALLPEWWADATFRSQEMTSRHDLARALTDSFLRHSLRSESASGGAGHSARAARRDLKLGCPDLLSAEAPRAAVSPRRFRDAGPRPMFAFPDLPVSRYPAGPPTRAIFPSGGDRRRPHEQGVLQVARKVRAAPLMRSNL